MKKLLGIISLVVCITMLLCGCGNWKNYKSVQIYSIQSDSTITFKMYGKSGDMFPEGKDGWTYYYSDEKSKEQVLSELKEKNSYEFINENGFDFIRVPNIKGVYFLDIYEKEVKVTDGIVNRVSVQINDMSCGMFQGENRIERFPFPYFMLQNGQDDVGTLDIGTCGSYNCNAEELLSLVKTLGIWEVEEKEDSFILSFKEDKVEVVYGDGTVTLLPVE